MSESPALTVPRRLLLGPGPSEVPPRVLAAMTTPLLGHLDPAFLEMLTRIQDQLRTVFQTKNPLTLAISGTGMAGMETCLVNLIQPGDTVLICVNGVFGQRMIEVAGRCGATVRVLEKPFGTVFDVNEIREAIGKHRPRAVGLVHAETSTGAWQPDIRAIADACHDEDALLILDTVTSLGGVPVEIDAWGVDAVYSASQKCLGAPPGLSPVSFSPRAVEVLTRRTTKVQSWYLDLALLARYVGQERVYHHTAPISMLYALHEALTLVLEEGLPARIARHRRHHEAFRAGAEALGLTYATTPEAILPQLNALRVPAGVDDLAVRKRLLTEFGIEVGGGLGEWKGQVWRVGLMGHSSQPENVQRVLEALAICLGKSANRGQ